MVNVTQRSFNMKLLWIFWGYLVFQASAASPNVCNTPGCVQAARTVLKNMDKNVDPCKDFYHFACGNYLKTQKVAKDKTQASSFITVDDILQKQLMTMLEKPAPPNEPKPFKMARSLYNICLRQDLIEERGVQFVVDMVKSVGGWPVLEGKNWNEESFNWVDTVYKLHEIGLGGELFDFSVSVDLANSFKRVIEIDQVTFGLNREYLIHGRENMLVQAYGSYVADIANLFGANHDDAVREMSDALDFEIALAKIALSKEERRDFSKLYNPMQIKVLQSRHPIVNWERYMTKMMNNITYLRSDEVIVVNTPTYLDKLQTLLKETDKRTLANHLIWRGLSGTVGVLTNAMRDRQLLYNQALTGRKEHEPRWKECLGITTGSLSLAIGAWYVRNFFNEAAKGNAVDMVEGIRNEMISVLEKVDWMDEETRAKAISKAKAMDKHIAYPNELLEDSKIEEFYSNLEITGDKFFESILNLTRFGWNFGVSKLRERINKTDWRSHGYAAIINAFYNPLENSVQFPAGILQNVFFSHDRPRYMNYGGIGFVIAHEITHGFDDMGSQFDNVGNLVVWWKNETRREFTKRVQCVIDQAKNYTVKSVKMTLNGVNTQGENVADSGGCKLSYRAYKNWEATNAEEPRLEGLEEYSPRQMFWLSAANVWCTVYREQALRKQIITGYHSPAEYRINGAFRNQKEFAKDFQCPPGSKMNPALRCNVW